MRRTRNGMVYDIDDRDIRNARRTLERRGLTLPPSLPTWALFIPKSMWHAGNNRGIIRPHYTLVDMPGRKHPHILIGTKDGLDDVARVTARSTYYRMFSGEAAWPKFKPLPGTKAGPIRHTEKFAWIEPTEFGGMFIRILAHDEDFIAQLDARVIEL